MSDFYGNQISGKWRGYIDSVRVINDYPDRAVIRAVCGFQATGWGFQVHGLRAVISINENAKSEGGKNVSLPSGSWGKVGFIQHDVSVPKGTSGMNIRVAADVVNETGYYSGVSHVEGSCWISAKQSYTISYNANGGSGAPGNQTRWYGQSDFHLSSTRPTRTGYTFQGWSTSNDSSVEYQPGQHYGGDANLTLYAVWSVNTWTVSYNANGGSGAPGNQTKVYGQTLTLSSTRPTRNLYNFIGWGTSSSSTTPSYQPGGAYTNNASITLYAIWELAWLQPRITNLQATRCDSAGTLNEEGQYAKVTFNWATDRTVSAIKIVCNGVTVNGSGSGTSGSISLVIGNNALSTENSYPVTVTVTDAVGSGSMSTTVAPMNYIMDIAPNGSVAFGKPANQSTRELEIASRIRFSGAAVGFSDRGHATDGKSYRVLARSANTYDDLDSGGGVRIVGYIGGYGGAYSIDVTVPFRSGNTGVIEVNSIGYSTVTASECSLQVIVGNDKYIYIVIWRNANGGYPYYDLQLYGDEVRIVNGGWTAAPPAGGKRFDSNELERNEFNVILPLRNRYKNSYPGMASLRSEDDWIRTTRNGLIPYQSGGASALGTGSWPFNNIYTKNMYINNSRIADHVVASGVSGSWRFIKWNSGICQCWRYGCTVANANGFFYITDYSFPFPVYNAAINVTVNTSDHSYNTTTLFAFMSNDNNGFSAKLASPDGVADASSKTIEVHVDGRWK